MAAIAAVPAILQLAKSGECQKAAAKVVQAADENRGNTVIRFVKDEISKPTLEGLLKALEIDVSVHYGTALVGCPIRHESPPGSVTRKDARLQLPPRAANPSVPRKGDPEVGLACISLSLRSQKVVLLAHTQLIRSISAWPPDA